MTVHESDQLSLDEAVRLHQEVRELMHGTVVSLLACYSPKERMFYTSIHEKYGKKVHSRDTAIVLAALETAGKDVMDAASLTTYPPDYHKRSDYQEKVNALIARLTQQRDSRPLNPIPYQDYQRLFFEPSLRKLSEAGPDQVLRCKPKEQDPPDPFQERDAFTCARLLGLLNLFNTRADESQATLYVEAAEFVVGSLARVYPPHFMFGGASLTRTEPHAFVSYHALKSLKGIENIQRHRAKQHEELSRLLSEIDDWCEGKVPIQLLYPYDEDFERYVEEELKRLEQAVGLREVIEAMQGEIRRTKGAREIRGTKSAETLAARSDRLDAKRIAKAIRKGLDGTKKSPEESKEFAGGLQRLVHFATLVESQISDGLDSLRKLLQEMGNKAAQLKPTPTVDLDNLQVQPPPGTAEAKQVDLYHQAAGLLWKLAFLQGTAHVLRTTEALYRNHGGKNAGLPELAQAFRRAGEQWRASADRTRDYVGTFSHWATTEIDRQIKLHSVDYRTNFDVGQLAFALAIDHKHALERSPQLTQKGLEIVFSHQQQDGTWPVGAPLVFERQHTQGVYVASLEIANALLPLVKQHGGLSLFYPNLKRILHWLEANKSTVQVDGIPVEGWSTDRIPERARIDVWTTALALEFLDGFRDLLESYVNTSVWQGKYDVSQERELLPWSEATDPELLKPYANRITTSIMQGYIRPFMDEGVSRQSSMLLYGPPGTAKTTLVGALAKKLGWTLLTITPSDFVKEGIERSEKMARDLFNDLIRLKRVVVLFDEIDEMLRDRTRPGKQESGIAMLRFIVPGMLPKLQNLKKYGERSRLIFVIATNYKDRLDSAVQRRGRIDQAFLIPPPDKPARQLLIQKQLLRLESFRSVEGVAQKAAEELADLTGGWVYKELVELVQTVNQKVFQQMGSDEVRTLCDRGLKPKLELSPSFSAEPPLEGYKILDVKRALDLRALYHGRKYADEEGKSVLRVCWPTDETRIAAAWEMIKQPITPRQPSLA